MIRIPTHCKPTHPGEILRDEFLNPLGLTKKELADAIHIPYQNVNDIINGNRSVTPNTALCLAKLFNTSANFWMNLQIRWDMYFAHQDELEILKTIKPMHSAE
jgi:addiction module HigA family antidote